MSISIKWHTRVIVTIHQVGCCSGCCSCRWTSTGRYATGTTATVIVTVSVATMIIHHSSRCCFCIMVCLIFILTMICE